MCRIFGISFGPGGPEAEGMTPSDIARVMAPALIKRGPHAYGWMGNVEGEVYYQKWSGRCDTPEADENLATIPDDMRWLVGHTRWATHGSPEDNRNNHPLQHGNILGVHNGVLKNHDEILDETGREDPETVVDSEAIFAAVDRWGHRAGLRKIVGAMVTIYVHLHKPDTLHIGRSYGRDLFYAQTVAGSFVFASEVQAIVKTGLEIDGKIQPLPANKLMRVREGKIRSLITYRQPKKILPPARENGDWEHTLARMRAISRGVTRAELDSLDDGDTVPARRLKPRTEVGEWDEENQIYHYRGQELTEREYIAQMMDLLDMPL